VNRFGIDQVVVDLHAKLNRQVEQVASLNGGCHDADVLRDIDNVLNMIQVPKRFGNGTFIALCFTIDTVKCCWYRAFDELQGYPTIHLLSL